MVITLLVEFGGAFASGYNNKLYLASDILAESQRVQKVEEEKKKQIQEEREMKKEERKRKREDNEKKKEEKLRSHEEKRAKKSKRD